MKPYDQTARTEEEIRAAVDALMAQMTLEEKIGQLVEEIYVKFVGEKSGQLVQQFHVSNVVEEKVNQMDVLEVENILMSIMKKELHAAINLGALIGFVIGLLNLLF